MQLWWFLCNVVVVVIVMSALEMASNAKIFPDASKCKHTHKNANASNQAQKIQFQQQLFCHLALIFSFISLLLSLCLSPSFVHLYQIFITMTSHAHAHAYASACHTHKHIYKKINRKNVVIHCIRNACAVVRSIQFGGTSDVRRKRIVWGGLGDGRMKETNLQAM